jgi:hypothetical protein
MAAVASLFERLNAGRPAPAEAAIKQPHIGSPPIEKLLDWLVNYWTRPTISLREIQGFGPNCIRDKKTILSLAQDLVERGWLTPTKTRRRDMKKWQITARNK